MCRRGELVMRKSNVVTYEIRMGLEEAKDDASVVAVLQDIKIGENTPSIDFFVKFATTPFLKPATMFALFTIIKKLADEHPSSIQLVLYAATADQSDDQIYSKLEKIVVGKNNPDIAYLRKLSEQTFLSVETKEFLAKMIEVVFKSDVQKIKDDLDTAVRINSKSALENVLKKIEIGKNNPDIAYLKKLSERPSLGVEIKCALNTLAMEIASKNRGSAISQDTVFSVSQLSPLLGASNTSSLTDEETPVDFRFR